MTRAHLQLAEPGLHREPVSSVGCAGRQTLGEISLPGGTLTHRVVVELVVRYVRSPPPHQLLQRTNQRPNTAKQLELTGNEPAVLVG